VLSGVTRPVSTVRAGLKIVDAVATLATPRLIAPRSSINAPIGQARRVAFVRVALDHLLELERAFEVTVNDVVLAAVTGGLRRLLESRGEQLAGRELQVLVPVAVRGAAAGPDAAAAVTRRPAAVAPDAHEFGNAVSAMLARLPVGVEDPGRRLRAVAASTARAKAHHQALVGEMVLGAFEVLPQPVLAAAARVVQHQPVVNLVVTNVPGPPAPLYAHGAKMLEAYPIVPLAGNLSLGVAALSYDGQMHLGLYADRDRFPDLEVLADGIRRSIEELVPERAYSGGERS
jgi:diacylglycerol O-acyltransferase